MDNELKHLKTHLNRTVYRGHHFTEKNKIKIRERIRQTEVHLNDIRFKSVLGVIVCFALLITLGTFVGRQLMLPNTSSHADLNGKSSAAIGHIEPFTFVYAQHSQKNYLDSVVVSTVNQGNKTVTILSISPNLQVKPGATEDIQSAFAKGELQSAITKVLGIPIQNVVVVTDGSFKRWVDMVGGITVDSPFDFLNRFKKGVHHLDGEDALFYFTMLKQDPKGEIGRMDRQVEVIKALLERVSIADLESYMMTHKKIDNLDSFISSVIQSEKSNDYQFKTLNLKLSTKMEDGIFYYVAKPHDVQTVSSQIKEQLHQ